MMWWKKTKSEPITLPAINPYLGVGYIVPDRWVVRERFSGRGLEFFPLSRHSVCPAVIYLDVYPDKMNNLLDIGINDHIESVKAFAEKYVEHSRSFGIHENGFLYASVEYTFESNSFAYRETHCLIADGIDGRVSVTASSGVSYWPFFEPTKNGFVASIAPFDPDTPIADFLKRG